MECVLTIAGSDCSGGAGIQADLKTFSAFKTFGMSIIVAIVAENTSRVISFEKVNDKLIEEQFDAIFEDIKVDTVKIGMLPSIETMKVVAKKLKEYPVKNIVVDPVMYAKNGHALMERDAIETLKQEIIPLATLITPNIPEVIELANLDIKNIEDMKKAAKKILEYGCKNVIVKGGHLEDDACDLLYDGKEFHTFVHERIKTKNTHGTGCTFSAAIAANLALGYSMVKAIEVAKKYISEAIKHSLEIGQGHGPTNHFYFLTGKEIY